MSKRGEYPKLAIFFLISISIAIAIACTPYVKGFGIATPYLDNDTLKLEPGQSYLYILNIQNGDDTGFDIDFNYSIENNIAKLLNSTTHIPAKSYDNKAIFEITIPQDDTPGKVYTLSFSAKPKISGAGQISMTVEIKRSLKIIVVDQNGIGYKLTTVDRVKDWIASAYHESQHIILFIIIIALALLVFFTLKRLWNISKGVSKKIYDHGKKAGNEVLIAKTPISEVRTLEELRYILKILPDEQFDIIEIKKLFSEKLLEFNESYLSEKILFCTKKQLLGMMKE